MQWYDFRNAHRLVVQICTQQAHTQQSYMQTPAHTRRWRGIYFKTWEEVHDEKATSRTAAEHKI